MFWIMKITNIEFKLVNLQSRHEVLTIVWQILKTRNKISERTVTTYYFKLTTTIHIITEQHGNRNGNPR